MVAIGSHEPTARETDDALAEPNLVTLADLVRGQAAPAPNRPRLFKSTGMAWEDAVVAAAVTRA